MKILNFTAVEILPALLNKSKTQTIRLDKGKLNKTKEEIKSDILLKGESYAIATYQPRFKVGEKVRLVWNQRSKWKYFSNFGGFPFEITQKQTKEIKDRDLKNTWEFAKSKLLFNKILGEAEITEVFKIQLQIVINKKGNKQGYLMASDILNLLTEEQANISNLAKRDGFNSAEEMFEWFNKKYDLSVPREFYVYRWKYL